MNPPDYGESREWFFDRQAQIGILLVVPQYHVEAGTMALDEGALEDQRLQFRSRHDGFEVGDVSHEQSGFGRHVRAFLKIGPNAVAEKICLADVQNFAAAAFHEVHAGRLRQAVELRLESIGYHDVSVDYRLLSGK